VSHLGAGSQWQGELHFPGLLRIDGQVEGPGVRGGTLIIGELAQVQAAIDVDVLQVRGQVQGEIHARQRVELLGASRVTGTIWAPRVEIWPGAIFHGTFHLGHPASDGEGEWTGLRAAGKRTREPGWLPR
jgi:cytoskeletal protein CcmA (bactofilin family)